MKIPNDEYLTVCTVRSGIELEGKQLGYGVVLRLPREHALALLRNGAVDLVDDKPSNET